MPARPRARLQSSFAANIEELVACRRASVGSTCVGPAFLLLKLTCGGQASRPERVLRKPLASQEHTQAVVMPEGCAKCREWTGRAPEYMGQPNGFPAGTRVGRAGATT